MRLKMYEQNIDAHLLKSVRHISCLAEHSRELFQINSNPSVKVYESVANAEENIEDNMTKKVSFERQNVLILLFLYPWTIF